MKCARTWSNQALRADITQGKGVERSVTARQEQWEERSFFCSFSYLSLDEMYLPSFRENGKHVEQRDSRKKVSEPAGNMSPQNQTQLHWPRKKGVRLILGPSSQINLEETKIYTNDFLRLFRL
jgi:hypothetical protein